MLQLYACLELAIARRDRTDHGTISVLDEAFARFLGGQQVDPDLAEIRSVDAVSQSANRDATEASRSTFGESLAMTVAIGKSTKKCLFKTDPK